MVAAFVIILKSRGIFTSTVSYSLEGPNLPSTVAELKNQREKMGSSSGFYGFFVLCAILAVHVSLSSSTTVDFIGDNEIGFFPMKSECRGSIGECLLSEDGLFGSEFEMDSETNRRILAGRRYISYGALRRNTVPCSRRGASYYNCRPGAQANPYRRGCSRITRCRG
ncbi:protein RALF-like 33 [Neltuma alba]|uniref:protein RALF-like 33 n=1 Tax=Neltuma alba TaxID=207710 RepID=UPI0010A4F0FC|nr:protein RALF-like 33 [Prosopis alba]